MIGDQIFYRGVDYVVTDMAEDDTLVIMEDDLGNVIERTWDQIYGPTCS